MEMPKDFKETPDKQKHIDLKNTPQLLSNKSNTILKNTHPSLNEHKKQYKNQNLKIRAADQNDTTENTRELVDSINSLTIAADTTKVLAEELLKYKDVQWDTLGISKKTVDVLISQGFIFPSPVQYNSIPDIIKGNDVLVRAKNGSGKTLSFIIPILEKIDISKNTLQAIIVVPIRELALQIAKISRILCKDLQIKSTPIVGGSDLADDIIRVSSGVHLLIGTPGRIVDLLERDLCQIEPNPLIIFDEADKLLDSIFFESIYKLLNIMPAKRQICLYSATFPVSTKSFISMNMNAPKCIRVSEDYTLFNVTLFCAKVTMSTKLPCLKSLLMSLDINQCIIYCNYIENVQNLAQKITEMGLSCYFIHSKMLQDERNTVFHNFSKNKCKILVSTDVTTRGTDVKGVNIVINFDLPASSESFLHRQGRSGRFGVKGCCITLISELDTLNMEKYASFVGSPLYYCADTLFKSFCKK